MSHYNTIVKPEQLEEFGVFFEYFEQIKYSELNFDALWKWSGILESFFRLYGPTPSFEKCIDIGGGHSPIHRILSNFGHVTNVDKYLYSAEGKPAAWFPLSENGFFEESPGFPYKSENIDYENTEFIQYIKTVSDNSISLYVDGCSLIHINPSAINSNHDGVDEVAKHIFRTLKPGGHFISCCDIYNPGLKNVYPSILRQDGVTYADTLFNIYQSSGLMPLDEGDYDVGEFYKNFKNSVCSIPNAPYHKRLNPCYSCNQSLPPYHAFAQTQDFPMLMARFAFTKPNVNELINRLS